MVLGTIDFGTAIERLLSVYTDSRAERPAASGEAILAAVTVTREGRLVERPATAVSSFAWGLPRALQGELTSLTSWRAEESQIVATLDEILRRSGANDGDDEEEPALDRETLHRGYEWLLTRLGLPRELTSPPRFAIRVFEYFKSSGSPEPLLLNSFFLGDLATAKTLLSERKAPSNLRLYLGDQKPPRQQDLLQDERALDAAVAPGLMPPARWPGRGRHPLVLLQQAAVNLTLQELREGGILGINGPPGTGKTTLLRDLVAAIVTARAESMAGFDDPSEALTASGEKLHLGSSWLHLYRVDPRLKGFEILIASSNNKAVENVSAELPGAAAIAEDAADLRYFKTVSDALLERDTWGLVAAVLGNAANRGRFRKTFWWDDDHGLSTYLAEAAGSPQTVEATDPKTGERITRPPKVVIAEAPPKNHDEALRRWQKARKSFQTALARSRTMLETAERIRGLAASLPQLASEERVEAERSTAADAAVAGSQRAAEEARTLLAGAQTDLTVAEVRLADHDRQAPHFFARLFRLRSARDWQAARSSLDEAHRKAREAADRYRRLLADMETKLRQDLARSQDAERARNAAARRHAEARRDVREARERLGPSFLGDDFWNGDREEQQKTSPWLDAAEQRLRDDVFVAAMALHRAFVDAAAKRLRHNVGALMNVFGGRSLPTAEKRALIPDLWSSLFLIVPLVSTTFASVERMLRDIPPETLGWLFVDEAGQALPQAAVGALFRTRRAVIVGDPMQIEPVVTLPDRLTSTICQHFGVDPDRFNAPAASAQTLADAASPYLTEIETRAGTRSIGTPLLVHRRCSQPMFGIANAVAYNHLMVHAKRAGDSVIGRILGPTAWIDVRGQADDKWCPEEGRAVVKLLRKLAFPDFVQKPEPPDLYIVTPFVIVAEHLRKAVEESALLKNWTGDPRRWTRERIGTVHTVQGREAEAVILVLGAPAPSQSGARAWAGGKPNLINVAVTRAKERLYVVGNRDLCRQAGLFQELDARLPPSEKGPLSRDPY